MSKIKDKFYKSLAEEFISKLGRLNNFIDHAPSIGSYHEEVLKNTLRMFLPERYSLKTGFVYVEPGVVSKQIDILIVDENEPPSYFFKEGNFVVVHPDAVICGIEIKTKLTKEKDFHKSIDNLVSLKEMANKKNKPFNIGALLFAYDGSSFPVATANNWYKKYKKIPQYLYPDMVIVLNKAMINLRPSSRTQGFGGHYYVLGKQYKGYGARCLSIFFAVIRKYAEMSSGKVSNPFSYALFDGLTWTKEVLLFGKGIENTPNAPR